MDTFLWILFYLVLNSGFVKLYETMYLENWFNVRYGERNNDTDILNPFYRIVNIVKSITLGVFTLPAMYILINSEHFESYISLIQFLAAGYSSLDMSAIIFNRVCHVSTLVHHVLVQLLYYYGVYYEWRKDTLAYLIFVYATYSSAAYLVNGRLALRNFTLSKWRETLINDLALFCYVVTAVCNWSFQVYGLITFTLVDYWLWKIVYVCIVAMIIYDDIFLMKYLQRNSHFFSQESIQYALDTIYYVSEKNPLVLYNA